MPTDLSRVAPDTRSTILAAAIDILHERGAGALTVRSVAAAAGCSTTGVYTWFGGKNGLVEAIYIDGFRRFGAALVGARARAAENNAFDGLAEAYRSWALANPTHYMVMFGRAVPDFVPSEQARAGSMQTFGELVGATTAAMRQFRMPGTPEDIAYHLWAGVHGYVALELAEMDMSPSAVARDQRFEAGVSRLWQGCLP